jgi:hypothetical protein
MPSDHLGIRFERKISKTAQTTNDMKPIAALILAVLCLSVHAGVVNGPVMNPVNGHLYCLLSPNTWSNAEAEAVSLGGHLATVRNADEEQWIYSTFSKCGGSMWIGLTDRDKVFSFRWTSGEPVTYTNWEVDQPDNGTGAVEFYVHIWPPGSRSPGKWNDYLNVDNVFGFPLYGVAELPAGATLRLSLHPSSTATGTGEVVNASAEGAVNTATVATGPELHIYTAIELSWSSESNRLYQVQWTPSLDNPQWINLEPAVAGTGADVSLFDSTKEHGRGFYRLMIVQ